MAVHTSVSGLQGLAVHMPWLQPVPWVVHILAGPDEAVRRMALPAVLVAGHKPVSADRLAGPAVVAAVGKLLQPAVPWLSLQAVRRSAGQMQCRKLSPAVLKVAGPEPELVEPVAVAVAAGCKPWLAAECSLNSNSIHRTFTHSSNNPTRNSSGTSSKRSSSSNDNNYTVSHKKRATKLLSITLPNSDQF